MWLLDLGNLDDRLTNTLLDALHKSRAEHAHEDEDDSNPPHENPWITVQIERVCDDAVHANAKISDDLSRELRNLIREPPPLIKAEGWAPWDRFRLRQTVDAIAAIPPRMRTLDDWVTLAEAIVNRYLDDNALQDLGEYLSVVAYLSGIIRAHQGEQPERVAIRTAHRLPRRLRDVPLEKMTAKDRFVLQVAVNDACAQVRDVGQRTRNRMRQMTARWVARITLGDPGATPDRLKAEMLDTFGNLNRDWRRIAITEAGNATNTGFIAALPAGTQVRRMEAYRGACDFCQSIRNRVFTVVTDEKEPKDWDHEVWPGKTNIGRSASLRKRVGSLLVDREPDELWSVPAGTVHPHCRGGWTVVQAKPAAVNTDFDQWARAMLASTAPPRS